MRSILRKVYTYQVGTRDAQKRNRRSRRELFAQDFTRSVERIGAFFNLYYFYSENAKLLEQSVAEQAEQAPIRFDEQRLTELLESNVRLLQ